MLRTLTRSTRWTRSTNWARLGHGEYPHFFMPSPIPRFNLGRRSLLWAIPIAAGITLYLIPRHNSQIPAIFSSPTIIPCLPSNLNPTIFSPSESHRSLTTRILDILRDTIWEPLLTAKRFIYLFALFLPVIVSSPMLLVGKPKKKYKGDRWGAIWWYGFLVHQMESAGPTFIKVSTFLLLRYLTNTIYSWHNGLVLALTCSRHASVNA